MITKRQKQVLEFIKKFIRTHDYAPSLEEIKKHLNLSSVSTAHHHISKLYNKGFINRLKNNPRAIELVETKKLNLIKIPIVGTIAAGQPIEAIEVPGQSVTLSRDEIGKFGNF